MERGSETVGDKLHCREGNNPDQQLRCLNNAQWKGCGITQTVRMLSVSYTHLFHDVTGGVYKTRERIHGAVADAPLLAIPASCRRVAAYSPCLLYTSVEG